MVTLHMHFDSKNIRNKTNRIASRCILLRGNKILMSYETVTDKWMIPGGGLENNEKLVDCCAREMAEETGIVVIPKNNYLTIVEYFDEMNYTNHYFVAEYVRETDRQPTENELSKGMEPRWIALDEIINILSKYEEIADSDPMRSGLYRREHTALTCLKTFMENKTL